MTTCTMLHKNPQVVHTTQGMKTIYVIEMKEFLSKYLSLTIQGSVKDQHHEAVPNL